MTDQSSLPIGPRVIVALDLASADAALDMARRLDPQRCRVKVGKELFATGGPLLVARLRSMGFEVFVDLKFHDIPHTVAGACRAAAADGAWMLDVHASGGRRMMEQGAMRNSRRQDNRRRHRQESTMLLLESLDQMSAR
ncbi:MAG: orotidine 5'-phosphate decarboxylase [Burkholderiales bacterium]|nr:orotidine 5'-phosphate decarboxylase [Burkholderiales bacterium]